MAEFKRYMFLLIIVLLFSCEDSKYNTDCNDCLEDEPEQTTLVAELDDPGVSGVLIILYEGRIEDNVVYDSTGVYYSGSYENHFK